MNELLEFLTENPVEDMTEELYPSERFAKAGLKFTVKIIGGEEYAKYQKQSLKIQKKGKAEFDNARFNSFVIFNHVVEPSFVSEENIKAAGCATPAQFLNKSLKAGEIEGLVEKIMELSGFKQDADELIEEAKN